MKTEALVSTLLPPSITIRAKLGRDGDFWYTSHDSDEGYLVVDVHQAQDLFDPHYNVTFDTLRRANVRHLELQRHAHNGREWLVGQPVDDRDRLLRHKGVPLGQLTLFMLGQRKHAPGHPWSLYAFRAAIETTTDRRGQDWVRFLFAKDWLED